MRSCKNMQRNLDEGAEAFLEFMKIRGHQVLLVPHYGSKTNYAHYHWHAVVNVKSYLTGNTLLDKFGEFKLICDFMSQQSYIQWNYCYHNCAKIVPAEHFKEILNIYNNIYWNNGTEVHYNIVFRRQCTFVPMFNLTL
ncbi:MAG: hypothetical protein U0L18_10840 [Acutalibacteraceae bacterium]|nr:hypothetical protein [Acutalibacteraceae bacterium]